MSEKTERSDKYGFKDKVKAEETLKILESETFQYQKLTVRGLLGRAKRVLQLTKAEEKIKNINEAIEVFEKWIEKNVGSSSKNVKSEITDKIDSITGLGFKDKETAEKSLTILDGRDPEYQRLAIKGLIGSSKRVLAATKNEEKIKSIKEGVQVLEDFLEKFESENMMQHNRPYLQYSMIENFPTPINKLCVEFLEAYSGQAKGNYKHLRTMYPKDNGSVSWDIIRNKNLELLHLELENNDGKLFDDEGNTTDVHLHMIHWAYSPSLPKLKKLVEEKSEPGQKRKRDLSAKDASVSKKKIKA